MNQAKIPIIMHVNYCEQGQELSAICHNAVKWGFDGVEFRRSRQRNKIDETLTGYLDALEKAVSASGLQTVIFGAPGPNLVQADAGAREKEIATYIDFLQEVKRRFGTKWINTFSGKLFNPDKSLPPTSYDKQGSGIATEEHYARIVEGFKTIVAFAETVQMTLGFETHMSYVHDLPAPSKRLIEAINSPAIGVTFDYANMRYFPNPVGLDEAITMLDKMVCYLHLKNLYSLPSGGRIPAPLADGQINNRELLHQVFVHGFNGPICVEAPRPGDREWFAREDLVYIKSVLADLSE